MNDLIGRAHEDVATLRRELVMYESVSLVREHGTEGLAPTPASHGATVAQEVGTS